MNSRKPNPAQSQFGTQNTNQPREAAQNLIQPTAQNPNLPKVVHASTPLQNPVQNAVKPGANQLIQPKSTTLTPQKPVQNVVKPGANQLIQPKPTPITPQNPGLPKIVNGSTPLQNPVQNLVKPGIAPGILTKPTTLTPQKPVQSFVKPGIAQVIQPKATQFTPQKPIQNAIKPEAAQGTQVKAAPGIQPKSATLTPQKPVQNVVKPEAAQGTQVKAAPTNQSKAPQIASQKPVENLVKPGITQLIQPKPTQLIPQNPVQIVVKPEAAQGNQLKAAPLAPQNPVKSVIKPRTAQGVQVKAPPSIPGIPSLPKIGHASTPLQHPVRNDTKPVIAPGFQPKATPLVSQIPSLPKIEHVSTPLQNLVPNVVNPGTVREIKPKSIPLEKVVHYSILPPVIVQNETALGMNTTRQTNPEPAIAIGSTRTELDENQKIIRTPPECVLCLDSECVRMKLRNCGHVACIACIMLHLQGEIQLRARVRIRCLDDTCPKTIHENDVNAILDEENNSVDSIMVSEQRQWLQYCHNKDSIVMGLAGPDPENQEKLIKRCPTCRALYFKREGCNNVRCANSQCNTQFCWECGKPTRGFSHFAGNDTCMLSTDDMERGFFMFRLARDVYPLGVFFGIPVMFFLLFVICPFVLLFLFPYSCCVYIVTKSKENSSFLTESEKILMVFKVVTFGILSIPAGIIISIGFLVTALAVFTLYILFFLLKLTPKSNMILDRYDRFVPFAKCLGLMRYKHMLRDVREARRLEKDRKFEEKERDKEETGKLIFYEEANQDGAAKQESSEVSRDSIISKV